MSERQYEWGDLVWVETGNHGRCEGIITCPGSTRCFVNYKISDVDSRSKDVFTKDLSPRDDDKPKAWRFPEKGDVARAAKGGYLNPAHYDIELEVVSYCAIAGKITVLGNGLEMQYPISNVELVRLRDDPGPPTSTTDPEPVLRSDPRIEPDLTLIGKPIELIEGKDAGKQGRIVDIKRDNAPYFYYIQMGQNIDYTKRYFCVRSSFKVIDPEPAADHIADAGKVIEPTHDPVDHPSHYTSHPSGVQCIAITEHENFCIGNAMKYLWRSGEKGRRIEDLAKAAWYVNREIQRLKALEARDGVD